MGTSVCAVSDESHDPGANAAYWSRRIPAVVIDWLLSYAVSIGFLNANPWGTLAVFAVSTFVLQASLGTTIGHRLFGLGVRTENGKVPGVARAGVRTLALCTVLPAVVTDADGRGLHERWSRTHLVRLARPG